MRRIELAPDVKSSILGFSCAPILGAIGGKVADRAIALALDGGVNHFDIARSYGYGEAEEFLGKYLEGRREKVVIASKFGIRATWKAGLMRPLKPLVRAIRNRKPATPAPSAARITPPEPRNDPFYQRIPMTSRAMVGSLERSLRALRTDYLDVFSIHEPTGVLQNLEPLIETAEFLKKQGKIRVWGLVFDWSEAKAHRSFFDRFDILQFNNSPRAAHYHETLDLRRNVANILFSPFRNRQNQSPSDILNQLWADFPSSVVLCSMFTPEHITANMKAASLEKSYRS
jgi:aryl-alcohol dehydrogenase-like predicted oxidoreductase